MKCIHLWLIDRNCVYIHMLSLSGIQMFEFIHILLHSLTPSSRLTTRRYMGYVTVRNSWRRNAEYLRVGLKGIHPSKARWMEIGKVRELYPHLLAEWFKLLLVQIVSNGEEWSGRLFIFKKLHWSNMVQWLLIYGSKNITYVFNSYKHSMRLALMYVPSTIRTVQCYIYIWYDTL